MSPEDISDIATTKRNVLTIPKLRVDSSNWATYSDRLVNYLTSKSLKRHLLGTARKPVQVITRGGAFYKQGTLAPLTDEELEKHEDEQDDYDQKQASVREVIYQTIDNSTYLQVKNERDAASMWKKVALIHSDKGTMYETSLLTQLQNAHYVEGESMQEHLASMVEIKEHLADMNSQISDESFVAYIRTSLSLVPNYRSLVTTLTAAAHESGKKLTNANLIWHLNEEANSTALEESINKSNAALVAAMAKAKGKKGKQSKRKEKQCMNCNRKGHVKDQCWDVGGGKEGQGPSGWGKKKAKKGEKGESANVSQKEKPQSNDSDDESENCAMLAFTVLDDPSALLCTSDFQHEALSTSHSNGIIIDCGASAHFSPD